MARAIIEYNARYNEYNYKYQYQHAAKYKVLGRAAYHFASSIPPETIEELLLLFLKFCKNSSTTLLSERFLYWV
jgi:hypothetical protein